MVLFNIGLLITVVFLKLNLRRLEKCLDAQGRMLTKLHDYHALVVMPHIDALEKERGK